MQESQEVIPFPAGDHKAARNRQDSMAKTNTNNHTNRRGVLDKPLAGRRFDSRLHQSVGWDFKPCPRSNMALPVGGTLNTNTTQQHKYQKDIHKKYRLETVNQKITGVLKDVLW